MSKNGDGPKNGKGKLDFSKFKISSGNSDMPVARKLILHVPVTKAAKQRYVRVHRDKGYHFECALLNLEGEDRPFLLSPEIAQAIAKDAKRVTLKLAIDRQGNIFLWPVPPMPEEGNENPWNQSQREVAELAEDKWVRLTSNRAVGCYEPLEAQGEIPEPVWPDLSMDEILEIAFGSTHVITDNEHPALQKLWGLE
tara:strand:- start:295 stop:882 length:588 start_codon:yes stop_codon:yes gene_type:complete